MLFVARRKHDDALREAGDFVNLFFDRDAGLEVLELDRAANFGEDRERVGIPFATSLAHLDGPAFVDAKTSAVRPLRGAPFRGPFRQRWRRAAAAHDDDRVVATFDDA